MDQNNSELRDIILEYGLTRREAAELMMVRPTTVDRYLTPARRGRSHNPTYRKMPAYRLKMLVDEISKRGLKKVTT